jgi:polyvinyl alcohol dehydrogenase (cytochrome)
LKKGNSDRCEPLKSLSVLFFLNSAATPKNGNFVGAGQKSGKFWTFNADKGALAWATQVSPGGLTGGLQWGSASDGNRIYVANSNSGLKGAANPPEVWDLQNGTTTLAGGWSALDAKNGKKLWERVDPNGSRAEAAVSIANGVVFGCNLDPVKGTMYALDSATGNVLWSYDSGGSCNAGPSIVDGMVFWGSGTFQGNPYAPHKVFAFGL